MDNSTPTTIVSRGKVVGKALVKIGASRFKGSIKKILSPSSKRDAIQEQTEEATAALIMDALGELKGISVKVAQ